MHSLKKSSYQIPHNDLERHGKFEPGKAHSTVMGIICPPLVKIGLTIIQNLGKARALEALLAVVPLIIVILFIEIEWQKIKVST